MPISNITVKDGSCWCRVCADPCKDPCPMFVGNNAKPERCEQCGGPHDIFSCAVPTAEYVRPVWVKAVQS